MRVSLRIQSDCIALEMPIDVLAHTWIGVPHMDSHNPGLNMCVSVCVCVSPIAVHINTFVCFREELCTSANSTTTGYLVGRLDSD